MKSVVFGSTGLLGRALADEAPPDALFLSSKDVDLRSQESCSRNLTNVSRNHTDLWINSAARVGGLGANMEGMGQFYRDNIEIGTNVIDAARRMGVKKLVSILSSCIYPAKGVNYPLTEGQLHSGPPHASNFGYAYAKRMLDVMSRSYRVQWGCNFVTVVPNNLYGPHDNYDLNCGHVIPSLIRKFYEAHLEGRDVTVWGTGKPMREFTFSKDAAKIIWWVGQHYHGSDPVNIGNTSEISIGDLAGMIGRIIGFKGNIKFDRTKPDGQHRKPTSNLFLRRLGCDVQYTSLEDGLAATIEHFSKNYPEIRGVSR